MDNTAQDWLMVTKRQFQNWYHGRSYLYIHVVMYWGMGNQEWIEKVSYHYILIYTYTFKN